MNSAVARELVGRDAVVGEGKPRRPVNLAEVIHFPPPVQQIEPVQEPSQKGGLKGNSSARVLMQQKNWGDCPIREQQARGQQCQL